MDEKEFAMKKNTNIQEQPVMVAIHCLIYNQEPYLRDCFDGFVKQQTNFRFVAVVHDDCSKDKSADIIREYAEKYPDIFIPIIETENQWSKADGSIYRIMNEKIDATGAKYVAYCEGDDYWIDPHKLQKQIDILEADETLMMCCTDRCVVDNKSQVLIEKKGGVVKDNQAGRYNLRDFFRDNHDYPTMSVVFRNTHKEELRAKFEHTQNKWLGDWTLWICLLIFGDMYYIDEVTSAYRVNPTSITHTPKRVERAKANRDICLKVADVLPDQYADIAADLRNTGWVWITLIYAYKTEKRYWAMIGAILVAMVKCPRSLFREIKKYVRK